MKLLWSPPNYANQRCNVDHYFKRDLSRPNTVSGYKRLARFVYVSLLSSIIIPQMQSDIQGLISKLTNQVNEGNRAACKKCGYAGHLTFQCRNFIKADPRKDVLLDVSSTSSESSDDIQEFVSPLVQLRQLEQEKKSSKKKHMKNKKSKKSKKKKKKLLSPSLKKSHQKRKADHLSDSECSSRRDMPKHKRKKKKHRKDQEKCDKRMDGSKKMAKSMEERQHSPSRKYTYGKSSNSMSDTTDVDISSESESEQEGTWYKQRNIEMGAEKIHRSQERDSSPLVLNQKSSQRQKHVKRTENYKNKPHQERQSTLSEKHHQ
ncbi:CAX-interacting protein 4 [Octopus sinensis]|uniref:Protein SREK1IP1 n=1 Tax=Octopus sinensis TaxID=2607531 RepID=A0A6P7SHS2_9MOLL|nr:CAX-interacting protein 4 [Octopus sinensis]